MTSVVDRSPAVLRFGDTRYDCSGRPLVMGILNVTPDSFSDGGMYVSTDDAIRHGMQLADEGADFLDVGGESTRPGSEPVPVAEETERVVPVIRALGRSVRIPISVDTRKAEVARQALEAGAALVNDTSGLTFDPAMAATIARHNASVVLMHMRGTPKTMQNDPVYSDLIGEIKAFLRKQIESAKSAGIGQIIIDPGIGFGKTLEHNLTIIRRLGEFADLGCPILIGPSRKSFIGTILNEPLHERLEGTIAAAVLSAWNGASIIRVHDVKAVGRALKIAYAVKTR